ncbi:NADH-quinone oxidoreductase subunit NuoE [Lichenifustis flavocetrariae]|uniref:NADH-quinone oxidoreductase subunit NuoE n=1 Tax=Lichenifustis flavocetrariae TaxID=2949735 RepID=UPI0024A76616|nr:NADH-quinone oxidoreductase subunit NuoE [Lichenifustis flavocetrariae]
MAVRRLAEIQPESFEFTPENQAWAEKQIAKYPAGRQASAVIALLHRAQRQHDGWLPRPAIEKVAAILDMPDIRVLEIATFYSMFNLKPVGKYFIQMCGTTPCVLRGSDGIKAVLAARIGEQDHVTPDGLFSWLEVECLGACCNAPMVQINDDYFEDLTPENVSTLLDNLAAGRDVKVGSQAGRHTSEPEGGLTTLTGFYGHDGAGPVQPHTSGTGATAPSAVSDQDNVPNEHTHGGVDHARDNTIGKPRGSVADTGTRTDDPVGSNQIESSARTTDAPDQAKERQEQSTRNNPSVPGPAGSPEK